MGHLLAATGVQREAALLARLGFVVVPGGGDSALLRAKLDAAAAGACGVLSFGLAGALAADLRIGDWVVADRITGTIDHACDPAWSAALGAALGARIGPIHADGRLAATVADKRSLGARGALAVDMESHVAAAVAAAHGLPFTVARCISDAADRGMPPAILVAMRPDGRVDGAAMLRSLLARPGQLPALVASIAGFLQALRALRRGASAIVPPRP